MFTSKRRRGKARTIGANVDFDRFASDHDELVGVFEAVPRHPDPGVAMIPTGHDTDDGQAMDATNDALSAGDPTSLWDLDDELFGPVEPMENTGPIEIVHDEAGYVMPWDVVEDTPVPATEQPSDEAPDDLAIDTDAFLRILGLTSDATVAEVSMAQREFLRFHEPVPDGDDADSDDVRSRLRREMNIAYAVYRLTAAN